MIPYRPGDREVRRDPSRRNLRYYWDEREGAYVYENGYALAPVPQQARAGRSSSQLPDYCRQAADFFKVGKVFTKMSDDVDESTATSARTPTNLGDFRRKERFVVVGRKADYCQVVSPLTTYNGLGVSKQGVIKSDHAIIYTGLQAPERLPAERPDRNEDGMRPYAIRVLNDDRTERLQDTCRVNFADMQKIPLDTPVKSFGVVADDSLPALKYQLRAVLFEEPLPSPAALSSSADTVRGAPSAAPTSWRQPPNRDQPRAESSTRRPAGPIQSHPDSAQQRSVRRLSTTLATASDDQGYPEFRRLSRPQDFFVPNLTGTMCPMHVGSWSLPESVVTSWFPWPQHSATVFEFLHTAIKAWPHRELGNLSMA
ncbi:hypothetical protein HII31_13133 [Pseudocercospora fuligena]|uniref:DUF6590 domain-containing protein n=1 Tax=Pseudocercospora fuligena TaxID=685502 RepID=A0A8H6R6W7_9PEZI|nr:hypothetical protein HII31_13133 [Pseudocercospora fuligena]